MRVVAVLGCALGVAGCGLWYRPVPVPSAIGKERAVLAGDSVAVHRDPRFEVYGPGSQTVFDAYEQLNRTYRAFDRYIAAPAPRLGVILKGEARDSIGPAAEGELIARGLHPVRYTRPVRALMNARKGDDGYEGTLWPVGPTAARLLLASVGSAAHTAPIDTSSLAKYPAWFRSAVMTIVSDERSLPYDVAEAKEQRGSRLSLERLLTSERPQDFDFALDPHRRAEANDDDRRFAALSSAFAQFLLDREGRDVLGRLARGFSAGRSFMEIATQFKTVPDAQPELEARWVSWLSAQRPGWDPRP